MTYITRQAALNGKPILGVSINYRVAAFGFLDSEEVRVSLSYLYSMHTNTPAHSWLGFREQ
jgi:triacylglycerol lipase